MERHQREMMVDRAVANHQLPDSIEQLLQTQQRAHALLERVLVENQVRRLPLGQGVQERDCFTATLGADPLHPESPQRMHGGPQRLE